MMTKLLMLMMMAIVMPSSVLGIECYVCNSMTGDEDCGDAFDPSKHVQTCPTYGDLHAAGCTKTKTQVDGQLTILQSLYYFTLFYFCMCMCFCAFFFFFFMVLYGSLWTDSINE